MAISSAMLLAAAKLYAIAISNQRLAENIRATDESARFALTPLIEDIELAGFYGLTHITTGIAGRRTEPTDIHITNDCDDGFSIDIDRPIDGLNNTYNWRCRPYRNMAQADSDTLVLRHADPEPANTLDAGRLFIESNLSGAGRLFVGSTQTEHPPTHQTAIHRLVVHAYYVSPTSSLSTPERLVPSLRVKRLTRDTQGPAITDEEIQPGIEDLQITYAIDDESSNTNGHGIAERWVTASELRPLTRIVAVKIQIRARSLLPEGADGYRRTTVTRTVPVQNATRRL